MSGPQWARTKHEESTAGGFLKWGCLVALGLPIFLMAMGLLNGGLVAAGSALRSLRPAAQIEREFDQLAEAKTDDGYALKAFKDNFPKDYAALKAKAVKAYRDGVSEQEAERIGFDHMRSFILDHAEDTAAAPMADLVSMLRSQRDVLFSLERTSVQHCADFAMRGLSLGAQLDPESNALVARATIIQLQTTRAGIDKPTRWAKITDRDGPALGAALRRTGASEVLINKIANGLDFAPAADQCAGSVALMRAIASMPDEQAARWMSMMLLESAKVLEERPAGSR